MARPTKKGLDYFPLDTRLEDKVKLIEAKYGIEGFGLLIKLYQKIYDSGYYIDWQEENTLLFSSEVNVNINRINDIINDCLHWNIFNDELYQKYNIITSHGIQTRFSEATKRRKKVEIIKQYNLLKGDEINANIVFANINPVNVDNNSENDNDNEQSKVKESKVENNNNLRSDSDSSPNPPQDDSESEEDDKPKFPEDSSPYKAACCLREKILSNNKRARVPDEIPEDMEDWATEMDRLNRLGPIGAKEEEGKGYSWEKIIELIDWCQDDGFWQSNILSAGKFREKIIILENQMKNKSSPGKGKRKKKKESPWKKFYIDNYEKYRET